MKIDIRKCPYCGKKMEKLFSGFTCVGCFKRITYCDIAEELMDHIEHIKSVIPIDEPGDVETALDRLKITDAVYHKFSWHTDGDPEPLLDEDESEMKPGQEAIVSDGD